MLHTLARHRCAIGLETVSLRGGVELRDEVAVPPGWLNYCASDIGTCSSRHCRTWKRLHVWGSEICHSQVKAERQGLLERQEDCTVPRLIWDLCRGVARCMVMCCGHTHTFNSDTNNSTDNDNDNKRHPNQSLQRWKPGMRIPSFEVIWDRVARDPTPLGFG